MRVLHVTDTFLPKVGGAEIAIDQLVRAMDGLGAQCVVLAQHARGSSGTVETPYPLRRFGKSISSRWAGWAIGRHIERVERELGAFDVLIGHHAFPPGYACVEYARRRQGRTAVVHVRGGDIYHGSRYRKKRHAWGKLRGALTDAAAVVCLSGAMQDLVREIIGPASAAAGGDRIVGIPNGIDLVALRADASASRFAGDASVRGPFVLGLGRTIRRKGFHLLIDAFGRLHARHPDWRLVIAGDGRELSRLREQAAPLGSRVIFTGLVEGADKRWLLQNCRFVATPSLEESFPNVALESLACGKPVVGSRAGGFSEMIRPGENGLLVEVNQVDPLADAVETYMRSDLARESRAAAAMAERFAWPAVARRYLDLLERLRGGVTQGNRTWPGPGG